MLTMTIERTIGRRGASVVSCDGIGNGDGAADQFMRTVMDAAAQFERGLIRCGIRFPAGGSRLLLAQRMD